ncbi:MAG: HAMP domain-containing sensor histidine kinase [Planctomycetota bacterium]
MNRKSLLISILATIFALALWIDDSMLSLLGRHDDSLNMVRRISAGIIFFLLVPGTAILSWILAERFRLSKERLEQVEAFARRDRLVVLGRVAGALAHEVRNPLHNLRLILEEIHTDNTAAERDSLLLRANANVARIDHAVQLVYRLARPRPGGANADVCDASDQLMQAIVAERERMPAVRIDCPDMSPVSVRCAGDDVRLALDNLLRNATAADPSGVTITPRCVGDIWEVVIVNHGTLPAWVAVEDDTRATSSKPDGLGLGLSISRKLINAVGGTLALTQVGSLVEARMRLPRAETAMS